MKLSIIDRAVVPNGADRQQAFINSVELVQRAEHWGYERYWVAEHHATPMLAARAPEVFIAALAARTSRIRLGSGSVLLNHYSPFKVAEVFCTLNEMYPGRIDLGAGRASAEATVDYALQQDRSRAYTADSNEQITELVAWLENGFPTDHQFANHPIHTLSSPPELHLLGSTAWSASAASRLGLRYVFAGFLNEKAVPDILDSYRRDFTPSMGKAGVPEPEVILAVHVICADTEEEARRQLAPVQALFASLRSGEGTSSILPVEEAVKRLGGLPVLEAYKPGSRIPPKCIAGTAEQVGEQLKRLGSDVGVDEIMIHDFMQDHAARMRSFELMKDLI